MNILVVCHYGMYRDLSSSFVHAQAKAYAALGHRVRVVVPIAIGKENWGGKRMSSPLQKREIDGVELFLLRYLSLSKYGEKRFNTASALRAVRSHLNALLDGFAPDVIHAHTLGFDSEIGAWLKGRLHVPLVVTTHGETVCEAWGRNPVLLKTLANKADAVVSVSSMFQKQLLETHVNIKTPIILNGFHVESAHFQKDKLPLSIVQAGYLVARKKADVTIRALASLRKRHPGVTLDIVGSGSELSRFQALCNELDVTDAVRFHGFLPNSQTLQIMSASRFFVMPSVQEGFGIVYLEAMASGCVTIGTEGEGIADLIISGENGFLVPPDDPDAIVQTIEWCLGHPDKASAIAERGRRDALNLTWEKNAKQYTALFQEFSGY